MEGMAIDDGLTRDSYWLLPLAGIVFDLLEELDLEAATQSADVVCLLLGATADTT